IEIESRYGDRRLRLEIPVTIAVEHVRSRYLELIAKTQVHGELAVQLPVVLKEEPPVARARERLRIDVVVRPVAPSEQHRSESVALDIRADVGILAGGCRAKREVTRWIAGLRIVQPVMPIFGARLDAVPACV